MFYNYNSYISFITKIYKIQAKNHLSKLKSFLENTHNLSELSYLSAIHLFIDNSLHGGGLLETFLISKVKFRNRIFQSQDNDRCDTDFLPRLNFLLFVCTMWKRSDLKTDK